MDTFSIHSPRPHKQARAHYYRPLLAGLCLWLCTVMGLSAQAYRLAGIVLTSDSLPVAGARVFEVQNQRTTRTDSMGRFELDLALAEVALQVSVASYANFSTSFVLPTDTFITITLASRALPAVEIRDRGTLLDAPQGANMIRFPVERLDQIPALLGEPDLLRALSLLPGVTTGLEGTTGLQVRGAQPGQNLTLLDGAPVYNSSHLFGLVSAFPAEMLHAVDLYKGWAPARFGGRIAGVFDLQTRLPSDTLRRQASVGLLSSRGLWQGRAGKGDTHYVLGGRLAYLNLFTLPLQIAYRGGSTQESFSYWLYDLYGKLIHRWRGNRQVRISVYQSQDDWRVREGRFMRNESTGATVWGNTVGSIRYTQPIGRRGQWWVQAAGSGYRYQLYSGEQWQEVADSLLRSGIRHRNSVWDISAQTGYRYLGSRGLQWEAGLSLGTVWFPPITRQVEAPGEPSRVDATSPSIWTGQHAGWLATTWRQRWGTLEAGLRMSAFQAPDSLFTQLEPRVQLAILLRGPWSLSFSYARQAQPLIWVSPTQIGLPGDLWLPAGRDLPPQVAWQGTAGLTMNLPRLRLEAATYFRQSQHEVLFEPDFIDIEGVSYRQVISQLERQGQGQAWGVEVAAFAQYGPLTGWLSYTWAHSRVRFPAQAWQPSLFDQRHQVDLNLAWQIGPSWEISANWILRSGRPIYLPQASISTPVGGRQFVYSQTPSRLPAYHRLDLGFKRKDKHRSAYWQWGVYNAYNRLNPLFLEFRPARVQVVGQTEQLIPAEVRAQGGIPFLPYLSRSWEF